MNGKLVLPVVNGRYYTVYGGPYLRCPDSIFGNAVLGVKVAAEINSEYDAKLDIADFSVPDVYEAGDALVDIVRLIQTGSPVYIGCKGGIGRTGLVLALLAKAYGVKEPVAYVRENYLSHAVETSEQFKYVSDFQVPPDVLRLISRDRFWCRIGGWFGGPKSMTLGAT